MMVGLAGSMSFFLWMCPFAYNKQTYVNKSPKLQSSRSAIDRANQTFVQKKETTRSAFTICVLINVCFIIILVVLVSFTLISVGLLYGPLITLSPP